MISTQVLPSGLVKLVLEKNVAGMSAAKKEELLKEKSFNGDGYQMSEALIFNDLGPWLDQYLKFEPYYSMSPLSYDCKCKGLPRHDHYLLITQLESEDPDHFNSPGHLVLTLQTRDFYWNEALGNLRYYTTYDSFLKQLQGRPGTPQMTGCQIRAALDFLYEARTSPSKPYLVIRPIVDGENLKNVMWDNLMRRLICSLSS